MLIFFEISVNLNLINNYLNNRKIKISRSCFIVVIINEYNSSILMNGKKGNIDEDIVII